MDQLLKEALHILHEEVSKVNGIKRTDTNGYIKPSVDLIVKYVGEYVKISKLSNNPRKVYFRRSHINGESMVDISLLSYDEASANKFKNAFNF